MKKILLWVAVTLFVNSATAQWQSCNGPFYTGQHNNYVGCLATNDSTIFAGTVNGVFASAYPFSTWKKVNSGLLDTLIVSLAINDSITYAGTRDGIFLSNNHGDNWHQENNILNDSAILSIGISGSNIFAGTNYGNIFLSDDGGNSWTEVGNGLPVFYADIISLAIKDSNIFAGTNGTGIFLSKINSAEWNAINNGISGNYQINSIAIRDSSIFIGTFAGVFLSTNNGGNWKQINNGLSSVLDSCVSSIVVYDSDIFIGTASGVFLSINNGNSWINVSAGLIDNDITSLAIVDSTILAGTFQSGVWQQALRNITGIKQTPASKKVNFIIYPNPTSSNFVVQATATAKQLLQVFDMTGKLILSKNIYDYKTTIDASSLTDGIYLVSLKGDEGVANEKLVVVR